MPTRKQADTVQCVQCEQYADRFSVFVCKGCRRTPLCEAHRDPEYRVCGNCADRLRRQKLKDLKSGLGSLRGFLNLMQFLFLIIAVIFTAQRLMPELSPDFIWDNFFVKHLYVWGGMAVFGIVATYLIYRVQLSNVREVEAKISTTTFVRRAR